MKDFESLDLTYGNIVLLVDILYWYLLHQQPKFPIETTKLSQKSVWNQWLYIMMKSIFRSTSWLDAGVATVYEV